MLKEEANTLFGERVRLQKYRSYLQTTFKAKIDRWLADCEDARHENNLLKAPIQDQIDAFGEGKSCKSLIEFEASYLARFAEKDKTYEAEAKKKAAISARERRFEAAFGIESDSEELRAELLELESVSLPPKPEPVGLKGHELEDLSRDADLFEYIFTQMEHKDLLSQIWFKRTFLLLHPDKRHRMPPEFQVEPASTLLQSTCKQFVFYRQRMLKEEANTLFGERVRLQKYRSYLQTTFKAKIDRWLADCEDARHENNLLKAPIQDQIDAFGEGKSCKSLIEFEASYLARFAEKDKTYEAEAKKKAAISARERRFEAAFGIESDSEGD
ncbi:uncharacterized protein IUM83_15102 [Phytophthora cinnamomi]|uniref:uncharacterized protein n=1 Tax=Phytophthora cinnamomi TaxID=4785 RepID=UPI003559A5ED|nr:hypothetical protein IUM83_15102 [Phytophthora cinnamomi]